MTSKDKEECRFIPLLQPNRDLAANWSVDVARELEQYLAELCSVSLLEDGHSSLNFAEAALLIQGSIQIYSRKVEYLYSLVLQALDFIAQKRQAQQEKSSIQVDGNDADVAEDEVDEVFLNLDDIQEETEIDIDDEAHGSSAFTLAKPPASLLVLEGECVDIAGDAGELASYQIAISSLHRDFLLLDPCDADTVDKCLNVIKDAARGTPCHPCSSACRKTPRSLFSIPDKRTGSVQKSGISKGRLNAIRIPEFNELGCSLNATDSLEGVIGNCRLVFGDEQSGHFNEECFGEHAEPEEDSEDDPWELLNPHESGDLQVKPYKQGQLGRKQKVRTKEKTGLASEFPLARINDTTCLEFTKAWEAREHNRQEKQDNHSPPTYEKLRRSFILNGAAFYDDFGDPNNDDENFGMQDNFEDHGTTDPFIGALNNSHPETDVPVQQGKNDHHTNLVDNDCVLDHEKEPDGRASFEDICRSHLDALLHSIAESEQQTELASRVSTWKQKIEKNLEEQDSHPPFDIHVYGERVLNQLMLNGNRGLKSFAEIIEDQEKHEVARTFSALLQLVNNGNVALEKGISGSQSFCFTAEKPFFVKLLSSNKRHQEMLSYKAPSMVALSSAKTPSKKRKTKSPSIRQAAKKYRVKKDLSNGLKNGSPDSGWFTPGKFSSSSRKDECQHRLHIAARLGLDSKRKYSGNLNGGPSETRCTPESQRRQRFRSFKPIEMQLCG